MKEITYRQAGVDIDAGDALVDNIKASVDSTMRREVLAGVGGFASLVSLPSGYRNPVLVSGTDGVGTKLKIAFAIGKHGTVGIDLVAMCVNDILTTGAEPLFFLDYYACGSLNPDDAAKVIEGIAEGCRQAGCALVGGETAEMPGFYAKGEYDIAGFAVGVVERDKIISGEKVEPGDAVLGLLSSGFHSNGYSLVRAVVERSGASLDKPVEKSGKTLGEMLIEPTRIYVKPILSLAKEIEIRALAHVTGGGLVENVPRTLPDRLGVKLKSGWPVPRVFRWIAESGPVGQSEMLRTFNMGIGMTAVVRQADADRAVELLARLGAPAQVIGRVVEPGPGESRVVVEGAV